MSFVERLKSSYSYLAKFWQAGFATAVALFFLLLPGTASADIESLYAECYSSSTTINNPTGADGSPDAHTAYTYRVFFGWFLHNRTFTMPDSANTTEVFVLFGDPAMEVKVQASSSPGSSGSGGGCFIATAAYGSYGEGHVLILSKFRDQYLLLNGLGRSLVNLYERYSPGLARLISHNQHLIPITRVGLSPLVGLGMLFSWVNLPQRWPLLVTMAVIISVLAYMEFLVRKQRGLTRD